jgi:hypothetical protein
VDVITPQIGKCTIFTRYVEARFATQDDLNTWLTRFYERVDWKYRLKQGEAIALLLLERGISLKIRPAIVEQEVKRDKLREVAQSAMDKAGNVQFTGLSTIRRNFEASKYSVEVSQ